MAILIGWVIFLPKAFGQNVANSGFVILNSGDTLYGELVKQVKNLNYEGCKFQSNNVIKKYKPDDIIGFGIKGGSFYTSQILKGAFLEVLVEGEMSLYKDLSSFYLKKNNDLFVVNSNYLEKLEVADRVVSYPGRVFFKKDDQWKRKLAYIVSDCMPNPEKVHKYNYSERSFTTLVIEYNKCRGEEYNEYKKDKSWSEFNYGIVTSLTKTNIRLSEKYGNSKTELPDLFTETSPSIGIMFSVKAPRLSEFLFFQTEFHLIKNNFSSEINIENAFSSENYKTTIATSNIAIPISVKYIVLKKDVDLFVQGGFEFNKVLNSEVNMVSKQTIGEEIFSRESQPLFVAENQFGTWIGFGLSKSFEKFTIASSIRLVKLGKYNYYEDFMAKSDKLSLNLIVSRR